MKYDIVYIVLNEGEVVYASINEVSANSYAANHGYEARTRVLNEFDIVAPTEDDIAEADFQAGFDGDYYEVQIVDISDLTEDQTVEIADGTEIRVSEIIEKLDQDEY